METRLKQLSTLLVCAFLPLASASAPELALYSGDAGQSSAAPELSLIDAPSGQAVQAKATADGKYQGLNYDLPAPVDLETVEALEFDFYQTAYHRDGTAMCRLRYDGRRDCKIDFEFKAKQWNHIVIKLTDEMRGNLKRVTFNVFAAMDKAGEVIAVADFKLVPRKLEAAEGVIVDTRYAVPEYWSGNTGGNAPLTPEISLIDSTMGKAVQVKALSDGKYQGMNLTFPEAVDTAKVGTIEFDFRQTAYHNDGTAQLILRYADGNGMNLLFPFQRRGWSHVVIPIDLRTVSMLKPGTPAHGQVREAVFTIYAALDTAGETFAVANLRFVPKKEGSQKIAVKSYRYLSARPSSGEKTNTTLTDGIVSKKSQIHYDWYTEDPRIEFDLGALYLIDRIELTGIAVPSQNISGIAVESSTDGKKFRAVASFENKDGEAVEKLFSIVGEKQALLGRYFRIRGFRSRTDFPIDISEVAFSGKIPSDEELRQTAASSYNLGPEMPEVTANDYVFCREGKYSFAVCKKNGILRKLSYDGVVLVDRMLGRYDISDGKHQILSNDYSAKVIKCRTLDSGVEVTFTVDKIDDVVFTRFYGWKDGVFTVRLGLESKRTDRQILQSSSEVVLPQDIRTGGRYESWGAGHSVAHKQADELTAEMPADTGPVVSFESPLKGLTFLNFRYRYSDRYVQIGSGTVTVVGFGDKRTKFTDNGWVLGDGLFELNDRSRTGSVETRLIVVKGDLIQAFDDYLSLPETKAFRSAIKRPSWLKDVRMNATGNVWQNMFGDNAVGNAAFYDRMIREGCNVFLQLDNVFTYGDWDRHLQTNRVINQFGGEMTTAELAALFAKMREVAPKTKFSEYTWMWSGSANSEIFKEHPEWFIVKNASGSVVSFFPGALNHYRLYGRPGSPSFENAFRTITNYINKNNFDFWYLDGGGSPSAIDWFRLIIEEPDTYDMFYKAVRDDIQSHGDRGVFFNNPENPLGDIGYLEGSADAFFSDVNWRDGAGWMYKFKLWQRSDPLFIPCFIYWQGKAAYNLHLYVIGAGLFPSIGNSFRNHLLYTKYISMYQQTRWGRIVSANMEPNWRNDSSCKWELMPLSFGRQGHLMVRSHHTETVASDFSCDLVPLGLDNPSLPVYCYIYTAVDSNGAIPEGEAEEAYRQTAWQSDFLLKGEFVGARPWTERLTQKLSLPANALKLIYVTPSPALVWSVDDLRVQYPMSEALDVKVSGRLEDGRLGLKSSSKRRAAEVIANLPAGLTAGRVTLNGREAASAPMTVMNANFVRFAIPRGDSDIVVELVPAIPAPQGGYALRSNPAQAGGRMNFVLTTPKVSGKLNGSLVICNSSDVPVWTGNLVLSGTQSQVTVSLPTVLTGDSYRATAYDPTGRKLAEYAFKLDNAPAKLKPWVYRMSPLDSEVKEIAPTVSRAGTTITSCAKQFSKGDGEVIFDPANASVTLQMAKRTNAMWNFMAGAMLNHNLKRYIKVRIEGNYEEYAGSVVGSGVRNVSPCYGDSPSCAVITLDYAAGSSFTARSFAGLGMVFANRTAKLPDAYGTKLVPEFISAVSGFCMGNSGSSEEHWFDLRELGAPADWNGTAYLGLCLQNSTPARTLKLTLLETADTLPPGAETGKVAVIKGDVRANKAKKLKVPRTSEKITVDGTLKEKAWADALLLTDFTMVNAPAVAAPPSQLRMLTDGKMLYIGARFDEPGEIYADANVGKAWLTDGLELYFARGASKGMFDQYIFSAAGLLYAARNVAGQPPGTLPAPEWKVRLEKHTVWFEAAIPLKYSGSAPDFSGFNAGRNRGAQNENYSLAPGNGYKNFSEFNLVFESSR